MSIKKKRIKIKIDGKVVTCYEGQTILQVAQEKKIHIPSLCYHPDFCAKGNCRVCVVEVKDRKSLTPSCTALVSEGMEISTATERVVRARNINIELIYAEHIEKCAGCIWRFECKLLGYAQEHKTQITRFKDRKKHRRMYKFKNAVELDGTQCIDCRNCIDACTTLQKIDYLDIAGKGASQEIVPKKDKDKHCILCGQCALHCPVSAAQEQTNYKDLEREIADNEQKVVIILDPLVVASLDEAFAEAKGITSEHLIHALKSIGVDYVFNSSFFNIFNGKIMTDELRAKNEDGSTLLTSDCPSFVHYLELYKQDMVKDLSRSRSPHITAGGIIKTYWAEAQGIDPDNLVVFSISPCVAKKYESVRTEMHIKGMFPVDFSLTSREMVFLLKKHNTIFKKSKKTKFDSISNDKATSVSVPDAISLFYDKKNKFKKVDGIGNIKEAISEMNNLDSVQIKSCPSGCLGGGGQVVPTNNKICEERQKKAKNIFKKPTKTDVSAVLEVIEWLKREGLDEKVLYTNFSKAK